MSVVEHGNCEWPYFLDKARAKVGRKADAAYVIGVGGQRKQLSPDARFSTRSGGAHWRYTDNELSLRGAL